MLKAIRSVPRLSVSGYGFSRQHKSLIYDPQDYGQFLNDRPEEYFHHEQTDAYFRAYKPEERESTQLIREPFSHPVYYPDTREKSHEREEFQNLLHYRKQMRDQDEFNSRFKALSAQLELKMKLRDRKLFNQYGKTREEFAKKFNLTQYLNTNDPSKLKTDHERDFNQNNMDKLVHQLGFLDFRDLLAASRYILEAKKHQDYKVRTRAGLLQFALSKMKEKKLEQISKRLDQLKEGDTSESEGFASMKEQFGFNKEDLELKALLEEPQLRSAYREIYQREKELEEEEEKYFRDGFKRLEEPDQESILLGKEKNRHPMEKKMFEEWEESLSVKEIDNLGLPRDEHSDISDEQFREVWNEWKLLNRMGQFELKELDDEDDSMVIQEYSDDELDEDLEGRGEQQQMRKKELTLLEQQVRQKRHYALEKVSYQFRKDITKLRRMYHEAKLKKEQVMKQDPFYGQSQENKKDEGKAQTREQRFKKELEKKYFDAKFRYYCTKILRRYDRLQSRADQVEEYWREHRPSMLEEETKTDFMFQQIDWNSDRSHVRDALLRNKAKRTTLKEIGRTLDQFILADKAKNNVNILKSEEQGPPQAVVNKQQGKDFYWTESLMSSYKAKRPLFMERETDSELQKKPSEVKAIYEEARKVAERDDASARHDVTSLTQDEKYEIELFHSFKKDPYFQHYVKYDLLQTEESTRESIVTLPLYLRGVRMNDFVKFNQYPKLDFSRKIQNQTYKRVMVGGKAWGSGTRKSCKAFAYVQEGNGLMTINGKSWIHHFPTGFNYRNKIIHAIYLTGLQAQIDVHMRVYGGGTSGQQDAIQVAVSRALANYFPPAREYLKKLGYMRNDPRKVERKKPGRYKARKSYVYQRR